MTFPHHATPWHAVSDDPNWSGSAVAAYRIMFREVGGGAVQQAHEWRFQDGSVSVDPWIASTPSIPSNAQPCEAV